MVKLLPIRVDFAVFPGSTLPLSFIFLNADQTAVNLTNKSVTMTVMAGSTKLLETTNTSHVDAVNGETHFDLPHTLTALFEQYERVRYTATLVDGTVRYVYFTGDIVTDRS